MARLEGEKPGGKGAAAMVAAILAAILAAPWNNGDVETTTGDNEAGRGRRLNRGSSCRHHRAYFICRVPVLLGPGNIITIFFA